MMKGDHIGLDQISDLLDNLISTEEEKDEILNHFDVCPECRLEYERLKSTVNLVSKLGNIEYDLGTISIDAIAVYKNRKRKALLFKSFPAIAASLLIIVGGGILTSDFTGQNSMRSTIADNKLRNVSDTEKIVNIIRDANGRILKVSDLFIEGEITPARFDRLRRNLGFRKVVHARVQKSGSGIAKSSFSPKRNIEEVSLGGSRRYSSAENFAADTSESRTIIRFRVFK